MIGLVGGIGAGKSTAARLLATFGGAVIDADAIGHDALEQEDVRRAILEQFRDRTNLLKPDGRIDRRALGRVVFENSADRYALQEVVFPYIRERTRSAIAAAQADPSVRFVALDAAVMLEAGWDGVCDKVVFVDAPRDLRRVRVAERSGWTESDLVAREAAQWSEERKKAVADAVVANDGGQYELKRKLENLFRLWGIAVG
ncbi:dephospho-CoA kinase [bacterium]|nr:dephospho-CoA kinase [bacterium]